MSLHDSSKYIIVEQDGREYAILFPDKFVHRDVAQAFGGKSYCRAAGFFMFEDGSDNAVEVYGHSYSLDLQSRGTLDAGLILNTIRG